ncbi:MAG: 50S ribosomal protein L24 [Clostridia bacterium]|nr:50S ribosomal protein L24 [Clostridia bacterium]
MHVKLNDEVIVISGKDLGKTGRVIKCLPKEHRVTVENINIAKRHMKARRADTQSQIVDKVMPIDVSNVMLICPKCKKPARTAHKVERVQNDEGKLVRQMIRVCKKCGADID